MTFQHMLPDLPPIPSDMHVLLMEPSSLWLKFEGNVVHLILIVADDERNWKMYLYKWLLFLFRFLHQVRYYLYCSEAPYK